MGIPANDPNLQDALDKIKELYQEGQAYINRMGDDENRIAADQRKEAYDKEHGDKKDLEKREKDEAKAKADLKKQEAALEKLDPAFTSLCDTINNLIGTVDNAINDGKCRYKIVNHDLHNTTKLLNEIFDAMSHKLLSDLYAEALNSDNLSSSDLAFLAEKALAESGLAQSDLNEAEQFISRLVSAYHVASNKALADDKRYNFWQKAFTNANEKRETDRANIRNASVMIDGLSDALSSLAPALGGFQAEFLQLFTMIREVVKEVKKVLANHDLSDKAKQRKVLSLLVFLLSFFQILKQDVKSEQTKNNKKMTEGIMETSLSNFDDIKTNEKIRKEEEKNAKIMKITLAICQLTVGSLFALAAPGLGSAILIEMVTAMESMQSLGVFNLTEDLEKALGSKVGGEALMCVIECGVTVGGGFAIDKAIEVAIKEAALNAADTALDNTAGAVTAAATSAARAAGREGDEVAIKKALEVLQRIAKQAAEKASNSASKIFMKQSFYSLMKLAGKRELMEAMEKTSEQAAEDAVLSAIQSAKEIAENAAVGVASSNTVIDALVLKSVNGAVAEVCGKSAGAVAKESSQNAFKKALIRGGMSLAFASLNTNLFDSIITKHLASGNSILDEVFKQISAIAQMLILLSGSGMLSGGSIGASSISKLLAGAGLGQGIMSTAGGFSNYETEKDTSRAVRSLTFEGSIADLLHSYIEQLQKDGNAQRSEFLQEQQIDARATISLAERVNDGDRTNAQILASAV